MLSRLTRITNHLRISPSQTAPLHHTMSPPSPSPSSSRLYRTAACLIIGDEVLNGKIVDTNSPFFARYCFDLGITLSRIETIPDAREDIIESVRRLSAKYDFVVTSGGIGPTHDDITYPCIAEAFGLGLRRHQDTVDRMKKLNLKKPKKYLEEKEFDWDTPSPQLEARLRMATFPDWQAEGVKIVYPDDENLWVPIVIVNHNIHILPGIPSLFASMLTSYATHLIAAGRANPDSERIHRITISTPFAESQVAEYLTQLQEKVDSRGVKVGSYPRWGKGTNTVTLVGKDKEYLESLVEEVEKGVKGIRVTVEGEADDRWEDPPKENSDQNKS